MLFMGSLLAGCSRQADSKPIATYPLGQAGAPAQEQPARSPVRPPIAQYPLPPAVIYHATLVLQVVDVDQAAQQAAAMAGKYGGYLANLQSWQVDGRPITSLDLAVPTNNFDDLRLGLRRLGSLGNETISGEQVDPKPGLPPDYPSYSTITVQLQPAGLAWPALPDSGWNPGHTLPIF
jgi:hypothetical protein